MGWGSGAQFSAGVMIFVYCTVFRSALGPTQPHIQWLLRTISPGLKPLVREADHSQSIGEVTNDGALNPLPYSMFSWRGA
jgi:hypothetical protein